MKTLIVFWHGIGDCIIATPAFREYAKQHKNEKISIALTKPPINSKFFDNCNYIEKQHLISNPWDVSTNYKEGKKKVLKEIKKIQEKNKYDKIIIVDQHWFDGVHKLERTMRELGIKKVSNLRYDVFMTKKDLEDAKKWLKSKQINEFVFLHRKTDFPKKDLPLSVAKEIINQQFKGIRTVEPGIDYDYEKKSINFSFALMKLSKGIVVVDSVFMHAAVALGRNVDTSYFNLRPGVDEEVATPLIRNKIIKGPAAKSIIGKTIWMTKKILITLRHPKRLVKIRCVA